MASLDIHPGYIPKDEYDFSTVRGLREYNERHEMDFARFVEQKGLQNGTVLDLGCGNGYFLRDLKKIYPSLRCIGVDRTLFQNELDEFIVADIRKVPLQDGIADLVVSNLACQWLQNDKDKFFAEVGRLKKDNGYAFIFPASRHSVDFDTLFGENYRLRDVGKADKIIFPQLVLGNVTF